MTLCGVAEGSPSERTTQRVLDGAARTLFKACCLLFCSRKPAEGTTI
jgi:hypothetical protein